MSNSPLVQYTKISPNSTNPRRKKIKKITIHHMAGPLSVETCGNIFARPERKASSNYAVGVDGRIAMYVEEKNRAWTSSSSANDDEAITIEVANSAVGGNWPVSDKVLARTIDLCVDICKRNAIDKLVYTGDKSGNLTRHDMFANTICPGPYLGGKFPYIVAEVNKRLGAQTPTPSSFLVKVTADALNIRSGPGVANRIIGTIKDKGTYTIVDTKDDWGKLKSSIGWIHLGYTKRLNPASPAPAPAPYLVRVTASKLNIRGGPGTNYKIQGAITDKGTYTIVDTQGRWGKLKSGAGWIYLNYTKKI
jgi:SH3-like domain-containing protein